MHSCGKAKLAKKPNCGKRLKHEEMQSFGKIRRITCVWLAGVSSRWLRKRTLVRASPG